MAGIRAAGAGNWVNMVSDASGGGAAVDFVKAGRAGWRRGAAVGRVRLGDRQQPRPVHRLPGDRLPPLVPALARPPLPALHGPCAQALGHALDRHPHHGRGRRHPRQGQLHHADRDRRVPAHVQLHPDLHRGHRAARARAEPAPALPRADPHVAARTVGLLADRHRRLCALHQRQRLPGRRPGRRSQRPDRLPAREALLPGHCRRRPRGLGRRHAGGLVPRRAGRTSVSIARWRPRWRSSRASSPSPWPSTCTAVTRGPSEATGGSRAWR